jgi:hypothetical protein
MSSLWEILTAHRADLDSHRTDLDWFTAGVG